jgi:hypothetical protein
MILKITNKVALGFPNPTEMNFPICKTNKKLIPTKVIRMLLSLLDDMFRDPKEIPSKISLSSLNEEYPYRMTRSPQK